MTDRGPRSSVCWNDDDNAAAAAHVVGLRRRLRVFCEVDQDENKSYDDSDDEAGDRKPERNASLGLRTVPVNSRGLSRPAGKY